MLVLLCDDIFTAEYLWQKGVHPDCITNNYKTLLLEKLPYMSKENGDLVLFVVHSCVKIYESECILAMHHLLDSGYADMVEVFSNVEFEKAPLNYYLYDGDLFSSKIVPKKVNRKLALREEKDNAMYLGKYLNNNCSVNDCDISELKYEYKPKRVLKSEEEILKKIVHFTSI